MKVKIWNDHHETYTEKFNNELIVIKPNDYIEMHRGAAVKFLASMKPLTRLKLRNISRHFPMLTLKG